MIIKLWNSIKKNVIDYLFIYFLITGIILILIHNILDNGSTILKDFGAAILSGGVLASILKSKQFTDIFSEELESIIYSDKFLQKSNDINSIWEKVTKELCKQKFQSINSELFQGVKNFYLPIEQQFYYKDYKVQISIDIDEDNNNYIIVKENIETSIVSENTEEIEFKFGNTIICEPNDFSKTRNDVKFIKINGINQDFKLEDIQKKEDNNKLVTCYTKKLSGTNEYKIEREEIKKINYKLNPNRIHNAIWLYHNISLEVDFPEELFITFHKIGVNKEWEKKFLKLKNNSRLKSKYEGIVFPNQGFMLNYRLK